MDGWIWVIAGAAAFLMLEAAVVLFTVVVALPIFERRPPFNVRPAEPDPDAEPVRFSTSDGLTLAGSLYEPDGAPRGLVVFCPEYAGSHWSAPAYAGALVESGFAVLAFDFRNQGESDQEPGYVPTHWATEREVTDVRAALRYAEGRADLAGLPVGLFGVSRGANAALATGARSPQVRAVGAEGAFSTDAMMLYYALRWAELYVPAWFLRLLPEWHLSASLRFARVVSQWRHGVRYCVLERWLPSLAGRPVLLITGGKDSYVAPVIAERLRAGIGRTCRAVWVVPGAKHNQARATDPVGYDARLTEFFGSIAAPPARKAAVEDRRLVPAGR